MSPFYEGNSFIELKSKVFTKTSDEYSKHCWEEMTITEVVNLRNHKYEVYIGRDEMDEPGEFGNPFKIGEHGNRDTVVEKYKIYFQDRLKADPVFKRKVRALKGKKLGCFCKPKKCHGDVIAAYLNNLLHEEKS